MTRLTQPLLRLKPKAVTKTTVTGSGNTKKSTTTRLTQPLLRLKSKAVTKTTVTGSGNTRKPKMTEVQKLRLPEQRTFPAVIR